MLSMVAGAQDTEQTSPPLGGELSAEVVPEQLWGRAVRILEDLARTLRDVLCEPLPRDADETLTFERRIQKAFCQSGDRVSQAVVQTVVQDVEFLALVDDLLTERKRGRSWEGWRPTPVTFLGGTRLRVRTRYLLRRGRSRSERRQDTKARQRGDEGSGCYADLRHLGIAHRATPAVASEVAACSVQASFAEATQTLHRRGIDIDEKTVRDISVELGKRSVELREERIRQAAERPVDIGPLSGERVCISLDGGRLRTRVEFEGGPLGPNGGPRYDTPWREPKVITITTLDEKGKQKRRGFVLYDATLGNADQAYDILVAELRLLGARTATHVHVCGDGAEWLWERVYRLVDDVGIDPEKITELVDWFHATEKLGELADQKSRWRKGARESWISRAKRALLSRKGVERLLELARETFGRTLPERVVDKLAYFANHRLRMRYWEAKQRALPLGSGVVESAVRRIVNLRLKNAGTFWGEGNAEKMLHLRAKYLSGGWDRFVATVLTFSPSRELEALA